MEERKRGEKEGVEMGLSSKGKKKGKKRTRGEEEIFMNNFKTLLIHIE